MFTVMLSVFISEEDVDADLIDQMKKQDQLESVLAEFAGKFPQIKHRLIDERDIYLAQQIRHAPGKKIVAVVGAGHTPGIAEHIQQDEPIDELMELPKKTIWPKIFKWGIPIFIIGMFAVSLIEGRESLLKNFYIWTFVNGSLSALGALIAFGHPLTIISAFIAAPFTSLNPLMAAGWVAALVQAWIKTPTVQDFEMLPQSTSTWKGWHSNPVLKVLLVCALANLGSGIGTYIAGSMIFANIWETITKFFTGSV
jgi:pheromone shutdown-related protein TraB